MSQPNLLSFFKRVDGLVEPPSKRLKTDEEPASDAVSLDDTARRLRDLPASETLQNKQGTVPYALLAETFTKIGETTKRLEIAALTSRLFLDVMQRVPDNLLPVVYLTINRLAPDFEGIELGLGETVLIKAIAETTGRTVAQIKAEYHKTGDLGIIAEQSKANQPTMYKPAPLSVPFVFKALKDIAQATGRDSQTRKVDIVKKLLAACIGNEARFIVRSLEGKLRIGLADKTVITALASATVTHEVRQAHQRDPTLTELTEGEEALKEVFNRLPSYDIIIPSLIEHGLAKLKDHCKLMPGVPLKPMLAKPTKSVSEVLDRFETMEFTSEYKYDGERAQIHYKEDGSLFVYSRNSEDMTKRYPDILSGVKRANLNNATSFVLDCEAVAWDREKEQILPFQVLSTRKRKNVRAEDIVVRVCIFAFDLLYLNGSTLLQTPFAERRKLLHENFAAVKGEFAFAKYEDTRSIEEIETFLENSVKDSCEGLMVKILNGKASFYEPSKRSRNWLKIKKDYLLGMGDSLDLVVMGALYGRGKRTNVYGAYLLGCYNPDRQEYETICKIGTGFSEESLESHFTYLSPQVTPKPSDSYVHATAGAQPDVWFKPTVIWEVLAADLSLSPVYKAAMTKLGNGKGISLRFPRFIRIREDKAVTDATTSGEVAELYRAQSREAAAVDDDFEY